MPNVDLIHNSDLAGYPPVAPPCDCPPPPPPNYWNIPPIPPPDYPYPPFPPIPPFPPMPPFPPRPLPPIPDDPDVKKNSIEGQICKLSKKAAAINRMLENLDTKKKDVIIKVGDTSFNFGNIDAEYTGWEDGSYAATVKKILEHQRGLIQAQIKELADELDDETNESGGTESAITG